VYCVRQKICSTQYAVDKWRKPIKLNLRETHTAVLLIVPAAIALLIFNYYPILQTFIFSLFNLDHTTDWLNAPFVGGQNYVEVMRSREFWRSTRFTLGFTVVSVFLEFWIGLGLALASFWVTPFLRGFLRAIIIIPWAIPQIIQASMWKWIFNSDVGLIGDLLVKLGLVDSPPLFLVDPLLAMLSIVLAYVWKGSAITAIFLMGGLALVPQDLIEAATIDGAGAWRRFWAITLPLLTPTILVTLLFRTMDALRMFDLVYGLTGGGPGTTTETLSTFAYKFYFKFVQFGQGSAYALVTFGLVVSVSIFYVSRVQGKFSFRK
jgi:ABC-type sugar transport system permease subunit